MLDGGCHCGRVRFRASVEEPIELYECNCSICVKSGFLHLIVPQSAFTLLSGEADLSDYRFNTGIARHRFCRVCGIKSFYIPRSNPNGIDINFRCLDLPAPAFTLRSFDGQNWEANAARLRHLSL